uniref:Uncharacterized protein n=1 Tax=Opuntia streptacantha TaxID=393608 RepID=A0A7C9DFX6_OPUST
MEVHCWEGFKMTTKMKKCCKYLRRSDIRLARHTPLKKLFHRKNTSIGSLFLIKSMQPHRPLLCLHWMTDNLEISISPRTSLTHVNSALNSRFTLGIKPLDVIHVTTHQTKFSYESQPLSTPKVIININTKSFCGRAKHAI